MAFDVYKYKYTHIDKGYMGFVCILAKKNMGFVCIIHVYMIRLTLARKLIKFGAQFIKL